MNYLPMARAAGAEIYTQTEIHHIEKCAGYYNLFANFFPTSDPQVGRAYADNGPHRRAGRWQLGVDGNPHAIGVWLACQQHVRLALDR